MSAYQADSLQVTVSTNSAAAVAHVQLCGVVDPDAAGELQALAEQLRDATPTIVYVDLAEVTFACSTLANFIIRVRRMLPAHAALVLVRPTAMARMILEVAGLNRVTILDHWPWEPFGQPEPAGSLSA